MKHIKIFEDFKGGTPPTKEEITAVNKYLKGQEKRSGGFDICYLLQLWPSGELVLYVTAEGKKGILADAFVEALKQSKPTLPSGFEYVDGVSLHPRKLKPVTKETFTDDEYYGDYEESEFAGDIVYLVKKVDKDSGMNHSTGFNGGRGY